MTPSKIPHIRAVDNETLAKIAKNLANIALSLQLRYPRVTASKTIVYWLQNYGNLK